jgi:hypothetical protein
MSKPDMDGGKTSSGVEGLKMVDDLIDSGDVVGLKPGFVGDYEYWAMMDHWTVEEALCIAHGHQPDHNNFLVHFIYRSEMDLIDRTIKGGRLKTDSNPVEWLVWMTQSGYPVPVVLKAAVEEAHHIKIDDELKKQQPVQVIKRASKSSDP